jgi:colanic acid biosynthesis glycosyl transferase WcaI
MRIQLWSYNYEPEPTGIAPVSAIWARAMRRRGHEVDVVAAHPHYPAPAWGRSLRPYREVRDGIDVLRLPLWIGRQSSAARMRQELSYMLSHAAALPALGKRDATVVVSPSFPGLLPAMLQAGLRRRPWVLWLQDILPDGAAAVGLVNEGPVLGAARAFERAAYRSADRIVVIGQSFEDNLVSKGVPREKLTRIYNVATRPVASRPRRPDPLRPLVLSMGNIGYSQGLAPLVEAFERSDQMRERDVRLTVAGDGVAAGEVRAQVRSARVRTPGLIPTEELEEELQTATLALVSQGHAGAEFNVPSKLMNFMAYGIPVIACVRLQSELARIVETAGAGWITDSSDPDAFPRAVAEALDDPAEVERRGAAALRYANAHFTPDGSAERFERVLHEVVGNGAVNGVPATNGAG